MKMNINKDELTISSANTTEFLELSDVELVQVQGSWGNGCESWQSHTDNDHDECGGSRGGCHSAGFHRQHYGCGSHHRQGWGYSNSRYNSFGFNNNCGNLSFYSGCGNQVSNNGYNR